MPQVQTHTHTALFSIKHKSWFLNQKCINNLGHLNGTVKNFLRQVLGPDIKVPPKIMSSRGMRGMME